MSRSCPPTRKSCTRSTPVPLPPVLNQRALAPLSAKASKTRAMGALKTRSMGKAPCSTMRLRGLDLGAAAFEALAPTHLHAGQHLRRDRGDGVAGLLDVHDGLAAAFLE